MYIPFNDMPNHARVWVYQASREISPVEAEAMLQTGQLFSTRWAAHGKPLRSSVQIIYQRFVVIAVDEQYNQASGCSIDSSVALIKELEEKFGTSNNPLTFFNRTLIAFLNNNEVYTVPMNAVKKQIESSQLSSETLTFNNLVSTKDQLDSQWIIPAGKSWLSQFFKNVAAN